jgi:ATP-dependent Clp protease ATP-binding subunit ClpA
MMPKINVYLPDELAEAVKEAGVPVSAVCQRALELAVRRVTAIRETALSDLGFGADSPRWAGFTDRARQVIKLAVDQAHAENAATVGTGHLLRGILAEGGNLAIQVLNALEINPEHLGHELAGHAAEPAADTPASRFSGHAANALELTVSEAIGMGHNYIGCEHLLLGLVAEPDGTAGHVLRSLGADQRLTRHAISAALAGYAHFRAKTQKPATVPPEAAAFVQEQLKPILDRLDRLEAAAR